MKKKKIIVHIDLNCFFVQCEILKNPSLKGKCVAVGNNTKRSVISTSSYEARKKGIYSSMPVKQALSLCKDLILIDNHFSLYQEYSNQFFSFLKNKYPILEQASIDECYIDMSDSIKDNNIEDYLFDLQLELYKVTQLKCSIGCSFTKFLAKMGSDYKKPLGLTILKEDNFKSIIDPLPIESMYGIGKKTAPKLRELGINTIGNFRNNNSIELKKLLGNSFTFYKDCLDGLSSDIVDTSSFDPKSISSERTFLENEDNVDNIQSMIRNCTVEVVNELHKYNKVCKSVGIKLRDSNFVTHSKRVSLAYESDNFDDIYFAAIKVFNEMYHNEEIRLIGVLLERVIKKEEANNKLDLNTLFNDNLKEGGKLYYLNKKEENK